MKEKLEKKIKELLAAHEATKAQLNAIVGQINLAQEMLSELSEQEEEAK